MASSSSEPRPHEVFLSFRGEDTRNNFVSHLLYALNQQGIQTYFDDHNLQKGQTISIELVKAIQESSIAIVVLSPNYASSTWCLNELVEIMKCKKESSLTVFPIFCHVDPSDVRHQKNTFSVAFSIHEVKSKDDAQVWRQALREVADLAGEDIHGKNEAACIKEITDNIFNQLHVEAAEFRRSVVGIESRISELKELMRKKPNEVLFIGIRGMGGIGKTTTARAIYEDCKIDFEGHCFLEGVRQKENRMEDLQTSLLSKVLKTKIQDICNVVDGTSLIKKRLQFKKVLLVIDDLDDIKQLNVLAKQPDWFGPGSRIIITTRDEQLLKDVHIEKFDVEILPENEALQLLCLHAFKNDYPPDEDFKELSVQVLRYAGCLPLALKVLGHHLYQQEKVEWQGTLNKLKDNPDKEIISQLRISFDTLEESQQKLFLDIACFFKGYTKGSVEERLESLGLHPKHGIRVLIQKSLIYTKEDPTKQDRILMHDLLQEMGWYIVRQKAGDDIRRYNRLWLNKDIVCVLTSIMVSSEAEGICMPIYAYPGDDLTMRYKLGWEGALRNVNNLKCLELHGDFFDGNYNVSFSHSSGQHEICPSLRRFFWNRYPGQSLPKSFHPVNLAHLYMEFSQIEETPDFSQMPNLEVLNLSYSEKLVNIHPSLGDHMKIKRISLIFCKELKEFPQIKGMKSLEILDLSGTYLQYFPEIHGDLDSLKKLILNYADIKGPSLPIMGKATNLRELKLSCFSGPYKEVFRRLRVAEGFHGLVSLKLTSTDIVRTPDFTRLPHLEKLDLSLSSGLKKVHASLGVHKRIMSINFSFCSSLKKFPTIGGMDSLEELNLYDTSLQSFPEITGNVNCLKKLYWGAVKINTLPWSISIVIVPLRCFESNIDDEAGVSQQLIVPQGTGQLSGEKISFKYCSILGELPESVLSRVKSLVILEKPILSEWICSNLENLLENYQHLQILRIYEKCELDVFSKWELVSKMFRKRQEFFKVYFPGSRIPNWLEYESCRHSMTVVLPPLSKWYTDKFRGFVLSGIDGELTENTFLSKYDDLDDCYNSCSNMSHVVVMYIPFNDLRGIIHLDGQEECTLFELRGKPHSLDADKRETLPRWGLSLVYSEGQFDEVDLKIHETDDCLDDCSCPTDDCPGDSSSSIDDCSNDSSCSSDNCPDSYSCSTDDCPGDSSCSKDDCPDDSSCSTDDCPDYYSCPTDGCPDNSSCSTDDCPDYYCSRFRVKIARVREAV